MNVLSLEHISSPESSSVLHKPTKSISLKTLQDFPMQVFDIPEAGDLRGLSIVDHDVVWLGGTKGCIVQTDNQGKNWTVNFISEVNGLDFRALHAFNSQEACAMSVGLSQDKLARIYRTSSGGKSWEAVFQTDIPNVFLNAMAFWDEQNGIVLGDPIDGQFIFFKTKDGGHNWNQLIPYTLPFALPNEAVFAASNSCLTVNGTNHVWFATGRGANARVFYSSDQGLNWKVSATSINPLNGSSGIFSVAFRNEKEGIAVGGDYTAPLQFSDTNIIITHNGGLEWHPYKCKGLSGLYLSSVAWTSEKDAIVVEGGTKTFNAVSFKKGCLWAVGPKGKCARYSLFSS